MNSRHARLSISLLRWTSGLTVILEFREFISSASAAHFLGKAGLPRRVQSALGGVELFFTALFVLPFNTGIDGYSLLEIMALVALVHIVHGQFRVEGQVVRGAPTPVRMTRGNTWNIRNGI